MPISTIGRLYGVNGETLRKLYKYRLSGYSEWSGMLKTQYQQVLYVCFPENCGPNLSIDETALIRDIQLMRSQKVQLTDVELKKLIRI